jgi:hypothetical protein
MESPEERLDEEGNKINTMKSAIRRPKLAPAAANNRIYKAAIAQSKFALDGAGACPIFCSVY